MLGLIRLALFGYAGLALVYLLVSVYSASVRRERLEKKFDAGGIDGPRDDYIKAGMAAYRHGLRHRLLWLVFILPTIVVAVTVYLVNHQ